MALEPKKKEKPGAILAIALGTPKPKKGVKPMGGKRPMPSPPMGDSEADPMMEEDPSMMSDEELMGPELSEDFVDYASSAFPELAEDPMRLAALQKMVRAAMKPSF